MSIRAWRVNRLEKKLDNLEEDLEVGEKAKNKFNPEEYQIWRDWTIKKYHRTKRKLEKLQGSWT